MATTEHQDYQQAIQSLPDEYLPINEEFLEKYEVEIDTIKTILAGKGGVHVLSLDDCSVIVRIPSKETLSNITKRAKNLEPIESDTLLVKQCLIYPKPEVLDRWIDSGSPGLASTFARKLFELAKINQEAVAKKL